LTDPQITVVPQLVLLELRGDTNMQSAPGGTATNNADVRLDELGVTDREDDWGGMVRIGDEFSGMDIGYLDIDAKSSQTGTLSQSWGNLLQGDVVKTEVDGFEVRGRYVGELLDVESEAGARLQLGLGAQLAHRELKFEAREVNGLRSQTLDVKDEGMPYVCARGRAGYLGFGLQADYAINPDVSFGGDFDGIQQDIEIAATYTFADQAVVVSAGYRRSYLHANDSQGSFAYDLDLIFDGYVLAAEITF
jgi:hypothetical protein